MHRLSVALALTIAVASSCRRPGPAVPSMTEVHPNGLAVTLPRIHDGGRPGAPKRVSVERTPSGFKVFVGREVKMRYAIDATVDVHTEAAAPGGAWPRQRTARGRLVRYAVDAEDGGNGGTLHTLRAWLPCRGGYVLWRQSEYAEVGTPDFDLLWTVIEGPSPPAEQVAGSPWAVRFVRPNDEEVACSTRVVRQRRESRLVR